MKRQFFYVRKTIEGTSEWFKPDFAPYAIKDTEDDAEMTYAFLERDGYELIDTMETDTGISFFFEKEYSKEDTTHLIVKFLESEIEKAKEEMFVKVRKPIDPKFVPIYNPNKEQSIQDLIDLGLSFKEINKIQKYYAREDD